jgi:hypothetical protein
LFVDHAAPITPTPRPAARAASRYSSAAFFATIVSPRYCPQLMQTRCGTRGAPQFGQAWTVGRFSPDFFIHAER